MIIKRGKHIIKTYPSHTVLFSLIGATILGACILALPISRTISIPFIDLLFTSASLTTVTGLLTISLENFTFFGQCIILCLMQIGGLGLMAMSLFFMSLFIDLGLYTQILASEILAIQSFKDTRRILLFMISLTAFCEITGAVVTFFAIRQDYSLGKAIFLSVFHSVSAFCSAGISLFKEGMITYNDNIPLLTVTTLMIFIGGLGFVTWHEFLQKMLHPKQTKYRISWHTKLVLKIFIITGIVATILFWIIERTHALHAMSPLQALLNVIFIGVSTKSAGFLTVGINQIQLASILLFSITSFIGSAPASTGSGIKTSSFAIFLAVIRAAISGRPHAEIHGRRIARDQVYKAMAIISLGSSWILFTTFCLLITEKNWRFIDILFESVSAFSNSGMSTGITPWLTITGKLLIILSMLIGRIGALALIIGMRKPADLADFSYPEEKVILS